MAYCTPEQVKTALSLPPLDAQQADQITRAVAAVSKLIDRHCRRSFTESGSESRVYAATSGALVLTDDISATPVVESRASVSASWATVTASTYQLEPLNNLIEGSYWPYTRLRMLGGATWPTATDGSALVRVTGTFGWTAVPEEVTEAAILAAVRLVKRPDAPFGVTFGELGAISVQKGLDPDVAQMLTPYVRVAGIG